MKPKELVVPAAPRTSLGVPDFDAECCDAYESALDALDEAQVEYLVGGALAVNHYTGIWRDTKDLDLYLRPDDVEEALEVLADAGFHAERVYRSWLSKAWRGEVFVDLIHRSASGLHPPDERWFGRAPETSLLGRRVRMVPPEELLFAKAFVGNRYRYDGADVVHLVYALQGRLDWDVLLERAGVEHAGLLLSHLVLFRWVYPSVAHYVPDDVLERLSEAQRRDVADPSTTFRGRLLDLHAFEVDVEGWGLPDAHAAHMDDVLGPGVEDHTGARF